MASQILRRTLGSRYLSNPRAFSSASTPIRATLFPGDGIGPEIAESVKQVPMDAACVILFLLTKIIA
jgi:isocitrate dehydrogenase (NAD+)